MKLYYTEQIKNNQTANTVRERRDPDSRGWSWIKFTTSLLGGDRHRRHHQLSFNRLKFKVTILRTTAVVQEELGAFGYEGGSVDANTMITIYHLEDGLTVWS